MTTGKKLIYRLRRACTGVGISNICLYLGLASILLSIGFIFNTFTGLNYDFLESISPYNIVWTTLFLIYGIFRVISSVNRFRLYISLIIGIYGLLLWSTLFLSFAIVGHFNATEIFFVIPLFLESWVFAAKIKQEWGYLNESRRDIPKRSCPICGRSRS